MAEGARAAETPNIPAFPKGQGAAALALGVLPALFLLVTSISDFTPWGPYDGKRILQAGLWVILAAGTLAIPVVREAFAARVAAVPRWMLVFFGLFLALGVVSSLRLEHPGYSLFEVGTFFMLAAAVFIVAACRDAAGPAFDRVALLLIALMGVGVFMIEAIGHLAAWSQGIEYTYKTSMIRFLHPRFYNQVQTWTLPLLALLPALFPEHRRASWVVVVLLGMQWYLLLLTSARGSIVAVTGAVLVGAVLLSRGRGAWLGRHFAGAAFGVVLFFGAASTGGSTSGGGEQMLRESVGRNLVNTTGRDQIWREAMEDVAAHPWLGAGPGRFACDAEWVTPAHAHNLVLQVAGEWGVPAASLAGTLLAALLLWLARVLLRDRRGDAAGAVAMSGDLLLRPVLCATVLGALAHALVSGLLVMPASQVAAVMVCGWLLGAAPVPRADRARFAAKVAPPLVALAVAGGLAMFLAAEYPDLRTRTAYAADEPWMSPRVWMQGKVCLYEWTKVE